MRNNMYYVVLLTQKMLKTPATVRIQKAVNRGQLKHHQQRSSTYGPMKCPTDKQGPYAANI